MISLLTKNFMISETSVFNIPAVGSVVSYSVNQKKKKLELKEQSKNLTTTTATTKTNKKNLTIFLLNYHHQS